jgi:hypothetical protein
MSVELLRQLALFHEHLREAEEGFAAKLAQCAAAGVSSHAIAAVLDLDPSRVRHMSAWRHGRSKKAAVDDRSSEHHACCRIAEPWLGRSA